MDFVADSSDVTLQFKDLHPTTDGYDLGLDNVHVSGASSTVPEPASVVLMGSVSLLCLALLRRRQKEY
jgi:hypothetical protein